MARTAISKRVRFDVFKRDGFVCRYCGRTPPAVVLEIDHIHPVVEGGDNDIDNLLSACFECNSGKGARLLTLLPESVAEKTARIAEAEAQLFEYRKLLDERRNRIEDDCWRVVCALTGREMFDGIEYNKRDFFSIKSFVEKLGVHAVIDAAEWANSLAHLNDRRRFLIFCKVCWKKVKGEYGQN